MVLLWGNICSFPDTEHSILDISKKEFWMDGVVYNTGKILLAVINISFAIIGFPWERFFWLYLLSLIMKITHISWSFMKI